MIVPASYVQSGENPKQSRQIAPECLRWLPGTADTTAKVIQHFFHTGYFLAGTRRGAICPSCWRFNDMDLALHVLFSGGKRATSSCACRSE